MFAGKAYLWACALVAFASSSFVVDAQSTYDVIVVGSGPGGLVAAEYLSRDPSVSVLIIEAGPKSLAATGGSTVPDYAKAQGLTTFDIPGEYESIAWNSQFSQFRVDWLSGSMWLGKLVGGCSSINAALYFRPPNDYVTNMQWPFSAASMIAKMDENEKTHGVTDKPSTDGVWYTQEGYKVVAKAFLGQGYSERTLNDAAARNNKSKTFGHAPFTFKNGRRDSPANAFWGKMKTRTNVKLLTNTKVDYVLHSAGKATGVMYGGTKAQLSSRGTIIMAAGALSTPMVLIQSGIGPADQLNMLKGNAKFPGLSQGDFIINPYVGRNLFDTSMVIASFSHPEMKSFRYRDYPSWALDLYINKNGSGPWSSSGPVLIGYENFEVQGRQYEFQTTVLPHGFGEFAKLDNALSIPLYINNPESRAASGFDNNGAWQPFKEGGAYFATNRDLVAMQQYAQHVVSAMKAQGAAFLSGASDPNGVANWVSANRGMAAQHFGGSCYASSDASAGSKRCADNKLRVLGTSNIFVADASAMRDGTVNPYGFIMYTGREAAGQAASYISTGGAGSAWAIQKAAQGATCGKIEENVDYAGNDVGNAKSSAEGCCAICQTTGGCKAFTWTNYNGGTCWLKSAKGATSTNSGARSAQLT
ncbi:carbohydrate-binding protein, putative [Phytophthora infestans T30-4]|uniref:Carbohydrate-binding protein, putative n=3 Tax=Phytophthora infestans TaxID=4787 RepID=D0N7R8_PHYIT|nr:carbohydrate-binding protein, putative [Phytophthora infestans T30-4]EEY53617.1 carbohydrate-binding protein, putative [Phytophthora infestans T30-4]KAF4037989.1 PAN domain [Phytophthora infestans]KAF4132101.1 PAN domain [Phytophthora infestans]|eukprot:XP_002905235.1 carbohydrate-binding protein, putative [Phytophthora infestans T30-4]